VKFGHRQDTRAVIIGMLRRASTALTTPQIVARVELGRNAVARQLAALEGGRHRADRGEAAALVLARTWMRRRRARAPSEAKGRHAMMEARIAQALRLAYRASTLAEANSVLGQLRCPVCFMGNAADGYTMYAEDCELAEAKAAIRDLLPEVEAGVRHRRWRSAASPPCPRSRCA
jgi:hypothetical protein